MGSSIITQDLVELDLLKVMS